MKYQNLKLKIDNNAERLYIYSLAIFLISTILSSNTTLGENDISIIMTFGRYISLSIITIKIFIYDIKEYDKTTCIKILILFVISLIIGYYSDSRIMPQYLIIILGAYKISFEKIVKYTLIIETIVVFSIILMSLFDIIPNRVFSRVDSNVLRYSFGFKYSTYSAIYCWYLTVLYLYVRKSNLKWWEYLGLIIINYILYVFTDSRNELICSLAIILIVFIYNKFKLQIFKKLIKFASKYSMIIFTVISLYIAFEYSSNNEFLYKINAMLSGRFRLAYDGMQSIGITLFGTKIEWIGLSLIYSGEYLQSQFNYVDISYLNILYNYGVIALIIILYAFYKMTKIQIKNNNEYLCCFIAIIAVHSFIDPQLFQIVYNIFILLFVDLIVNSKKKGKNLEKEEVIML